MLYQHSENSDEIICSIPKDRVPVNKWRFSPRARLMHILELLFIGKRRMLEADGKVWPWKDPAVYVFQGNKVYRQDAAGNRALVVDGDRVREETDKEGGHLRWFVDSVEVDWVWKSESQLLRRRCDPRCPNVH